MPIISLEFEELALSIARRALEIPELSDLSKQLIVLHSKEKDRQHGGGEKPFCPVEDSGC